MDLVNTGKTAAHGVHGWIHFEEEKLAPYKRPPPPRTTDDYGLGRVHFPILPSDIKLSYGESFQNDQEPKDGHYEAQAWEKERLLPGTYRRYEFRLAIRNVGKTRIPYNFVSANGAEVEGTETVEIQSAK